MYVWRERLETTCKRQASGTDTDSRLIDIDEDGDDDDLKRYIWITRTGGRVGGPHSCMWVMGAAYPDTQTDCLP